MREERDAGPWTRRRTVVDHSQAPTESRSFGFWPLSLVCCVACVLVWVACSESRGAEPDEASESIVEAGPIQAAIPEAGIVDFATESVATAISDSEPLCCAAPSEATSMHEGGDKERHFIVDYDSGFVIRPVDKKRHPFELKVNSRMQFRHTGFGRDIQTFTNNAGIVIPIQNRNDFDIERGRLAFEGFVYDPKLNFFLNLDFDTDDSHRVIAHDFWFDYKFSKAFDLYVGKAFVPGSRDWLSGSTRTRLVDRSLATTFFRPDRTVGVWAIGEPVDDVHYRAMVGNGFNTTDLRFSQVDTHFVYSASVWWEPLGDFGKGYADLQMHESPVMRIGNSATFASQGAGAGGNPRSEQNFLRISDGTRVILPGALAPGVTVNEFDIYLYTIDCAAKYRGFSANFEWFLRWLNSFAANGPLPVTALFDAGFVSEFGFFLIPKKLDVNARISQVNGLYGDAWEYAAGWNWYINGTHKNKLSFDVTRLTQSPVSNSGPNFIVGEKGVVVRTQWQIAF